VFEWTCRVARLEPASERTRVLMRAVAASREHTAKFLGLIAGTVHAADFFDPSNVQRILATTA